MTQAGISEILLRNFCPLEDGISIKGNEIQSNFSTTIQNDIVAQMLRDGYLRSAEGRICLGKRGEALVVEMCI